MIRIHLEPSTRDELQSLRRKPLPPKVRDRIEMLTLADAGWSAPKIAGHLGHCGQTVRDLLKDFLRREPVPSTHTRPDRNLTQPVAAV